MNRSALNHLAAATALAAYSVVAVADDELVVYALEEGQAASGAMVVLNGRVERPISEDGSVVFDLNGGAHSLAIKRDGEIIHSLRFDSADGQLVDINVALSAGDDPQVSIESYFKTETARERLQAPTGTVSGRIFSGSEALAGATIEVVGTSYSTQTDDAGRYVLDLPRGEYQFEITHPSLSAPERESVRVVSYVSKSKNFQIGQIGSLGEGLQPLTQLEEIVVTAKFNPAAFGESERFSVNILETIGIEQLARFGDTDVAASVVRVPSVTVQDDRFIFIRGLGGRYITTTLNGATMPSTDPTKREVPLDLFPANLVKQLDVKKTFIAEMPGESTGGNLVINTRTFPEMAEGKLSVSLGYTNGLTGDEVYTDPSDGDWDWIGWDDGSRQEPPAVEAIAALLGCAECQDEISPSVRQELGQVAGLLLKDNLDVDTGTASPNVSFGANYGNVFLLGNGDEFGFFAGGNYKNGWGQKESGVDRTYNAGGVVADDFEFEEFTHNIDASGLLALGYNRGNSSYQANTLVSRSTDSKVRVSQGFDGDQLLDSYRYSMEWAERQFISQQFAGEHVLGFGSSFVADWQITGSQAKRYAPDRREARFDLQGGDEVYNLIVPELVRRYDDLVDDNYDLSANFEAVLPSTMNTESVVSFGVQSIMRERDSESASYGYTGGQTSVDDNAPNRRVSDVITIDNITGDTSTGYTFQDKTLPSDSYDAEMDLNSVYVSYDLRWFDSYQLIAGLRYEDYQQTTNTFSLAGEQAPVRSKIDEGILLPTLSFNWDISDDQKLRLAASKTVSRPDFKETSNAVFYDTQFDFRVRGNPNLKVSEVLNFDVRWELYWSDQETISIAGFYKDLTDPIERVVQLASGTAGNSRTFRNAEAAEIYGVELDGRKDFSINDDQTRNFFVALNTSYIESEVELQTGETRKLQGQPDYTLNLVLGYDDFASRYRQEFTALLNQSGETIVDVGVSGLPDIIEEPRLSLNLNYKLYLSEEFVIKTKIKNLLDAEVEFTQGGQIFQKYNRGVELEAGVDWNF